MEEEQFKRRIVVIDPYMQKTPESRTVHLDGMTCEVQIFYVGFHFDVMKEVIRSQRSICDAVVLSGMPSGLSDGKKVYRFSQYDELVETAGEVPVFTGEQLREFYARWMLRRAISTNIHLFRHKKVVFQVHSAMPVSDVFKDVTSKISYLDAVAVFGIPTVYKSLGALSRFLKIAMPLTKKLDIKQISPSHSWKRLILNKIGAKAIKESEVVVTFAKQLNMFHEFSVFKGKVLIIDRLSTYQRRQLERAGVLFIVEFLPETKYVEELGVKTFATLNALIYFSKMWHGDPRTTEEYSYEWISRHKLFVDPPLCKSVPRRASFIIHPLSRKQLWNANTINKINTLPLDVKKLVEKVLARFPVMKVGSVTGIESQQTGIRAEVDLYAIFATPKQLLSMDPDVVYDSIVGAINRSASDGALMSGLGAYTKVVGDAGFSINKRADIPVSTGNSYSTAATIWAAKSVTEKLGLLKRPNENELIDGKAMVIGASGSIGRVSSIMMASTFREVCLVAPRVDKLFELRSEISKKYPGTTVTVTNNANTDIHKMDVVITATSNQSGSILDVMKIKPGAVVCDCSRPLDIPKSEALKRPDILIIESGEIELPGNVKIDIDIGIPKPSVYACLAEVALLTLEGRYEPFSLTRELSLARVKEIYKIGLKHGASLSTVMTHEGPLTDAKIDDVRKRALINRKKG